MKIPLLRRKSKTQKDKQDTPPGWQPARQATDQLDLPVKSLLRDDTVLLETGLKIARCLCDRARTLPGARTGIILADACWHAVLVSPLPVAVQGIHRRTHRP